MPLSCSDVIDCKILTESITVTWIIAFHWLNSSNKLNYLIVDETGKI